MSSPPPSTASAPVEISRIALTVHDLEGMAAFYRQALGLADLSSEPGLRRLGVDGRTLIELRADAAAARSSRHDAGLFHTAFLMPNRPALARWLRHAADTGLRLQGASDHLVSEAIYLADPEGNGIEVYVDRPRSAWHDATGAVKMATEALDLNALVRAADGPWTTAPDGLVVGHVHLQVGALPEAEAFYSGTLGLPVMARYPGAAFYGAGGYHHHIATNVWNSRSAGRRSYPSTGLAELVLATDPSVEAGIIARGGADRMEDPWGTLIALEPKAA
ncbi:VOC family protein [Tabrizicola piscis]|uniref:VOC family protein n=1 Tax=Tabrizicola piscis TaxID=2494374 RepID=A0A3S8U6S0_9RHOB|nr:VOC family protein [Tabrizicola piscis]AZL59220.1 VOC family protein [Tabrizicola piscis]